MNEQYSSSYGKMTKKKGSYNPSIKIRKLNVSVPPISRKTTNMRRKMFGKGKKPSVRMSSAPTNQSPKAVSKVTSGRPGVGKTFGYSSKGIDSRVMQVSPAQRGVLKKKMSPTVAVNPRMQNKKQISNMGGGRKGSLAMYRTSIRKTMGY